MASSSSSFKSRGPAPELCDDVQVMLSADPLNPRNCYCKDRARLYTSFKLWSLGRRFLGCPNYWRFKRGLCDRKCGLFVWVDSEQQFPKRATELILELRRRELSLLDENEALKRQIQLLVSRSYEQGEVEDYVGGGCGNERHISEMLEAVELESAKSLEKAIKGHVRKLRMQMFCIFFAGFLCYLFISWE